MKFIKDKVTKGAIRFREESDNPIIGTLYVRKERLKELGLEGAETVEVEIRRGDKE